MRAMNLKYLYKIVIFVFITQQYDLHEALIAKILDLFPNLPKLFELCLNAWKIYVFNIGYMRTKITKSCRNVMYLYLLLNHRISLD